MLRACEHIQDDGIRCPNPAMYRRQVCFYHWRLHQPAAPVTDPNYVPPILDSEASITIATSHLLRAILAGKIDLRRAQVAMSCLREAAKSLRLQARAGDGAETSSTPFMADYFSNLDLGQARANAVYSDPAPLLYPATFKDIDDASPIDDAPAAAQTSPPALPRPTTLSARELARLRKIVRLGRAHPQFREATRILDRHIAASVP